MSMSFRSCPRCGGEVRSDDRVCSHCGASIERDPAEDTPPAARERRSAWSELGERLQAATGDRYRVDRLLGYGGMAGVFLADDLRLDRKVAIKVMSPGLMMDHGLVDRFEREARTIAKLEHPNIVTIYEVGRGEGLHFFTMTYVPGRALGTVMAERDGGFPIPVVRGILSQVAEALAYAHRTGVVHRDVKPGNILLDEEGAAVVTDFGIAKVADTPSITRTGMLVGTPSYMSPEQCGDTEVGGPSDQYSLGAVAYQMLTGAPPFRGPTATVLHAHLHEPPPSLQERRPDCPADLAAVVTRMLAKKPHERWPDMSAVARAVDAPALRTDDPVREELRELATPAAEVSVRPSTLELDLGERRRLEADVLRDDGRRLTSRSVSWRASDPDVAVVTRDGIVGAVGEGRGTVRASTGGVSAEVEVAVSPAAAGTVERLELRPDPLDLEKGGSATLSARAVLEDGRTLDDPAVAWSSDDPEVVTVSPSGRARSVSAGTTRIRARLGEASASVPVRVLEASALEGKGGIEGRGGPGGRGRATTAASGRSGRGSGREPGRATAEQQGWRRGSVLAAAAVGVLAVLALAVWRPWSDGSSADPAEPVPSGSPAVATPPGEDGRDADGAGSSSAAATVGSTGQDADGSADGDGGQSGGEVAAAGSSTDPTASSGGASGSSAEDPDASSAGEEVAASEPSADGAAGPPGEPGTGLVRLAGAVPDAPRAVARPVGGGTVRPFIGDSIALPPGEYDLELVRPDDRIVRETVRVVAGETVEWSVPAATVADAGDAANDGGAGAADGAGTPEPGDEAAGDAAAESASEIERARSQARAAVDAFVQAFGARRTGEVVPLLPASAREGWRALLESDDVEDFTASLSETEEPRIDVDAGSGSVEFSVNLAYRNLNRNVRQGLSLSGELERRSGSWVLTAVSILP